MGFVKKLENTTATNCGVDPCFKPFTMVGTVSVNLSDAEQKQVCILRGTGASQTLIHADTLPFTEKTYAGYNVILRGVEMGYVPQPVHYVCLKTDLISGVFPMAVCAALSIANVSVLLGNDIAGGKVVPALEVLDKPDKDRLRSVGVVTRAQARRNKSKDEAVGLSDSFLLSSL